MRVDGTDCRPSRNSSPLSAMSSIGTPRLSAEDPRMGELIQMCTIDQFLAAQQPQAGAGREAATHRTTVVVAGFPYDEGCRRNGGRVGAAGGPSCVRGFMQKMGTAVNPEWASADPHAKTGLDLSTLSHVDVGDVEPQLTLEAALTSLEQRTASLLQSGSHVIPFVLGGSNDQSYPNAAALMHAVGKPGSIGVINIDAHLDVRPLKEGLAHSGSPFRQMLEDPRFRAAGEAASTAALRFVEFAAQGNQCSQAHADFVTRTHGQKIRWISELRESIEREKEHHAASASASSSAASSAALPSPVSLPASRGMGKQFLQTLNSLQAEHVFVSFDLDAVSGADAPGVSCPGTIGLTAAEALDICFVAGAHPRVRLFDLSEFNPAVDSYRTGRLVTNMWYWFCMGVASRTEKK